MSESTDNPYKAPEADIAPEARSDGSFAPFPRFSAWWVFLLGIVTLGIYPIYWMFSRTQILNRHFPDLAIAAAFVWSAVALYAIDWLAGLADVIRTFDGGAVASPDSPAAIAGLLVSLAAWILLIAWSMMLCNRLNRVSDDIPGEHFNPVVTFFLALIYFSPIYLAYKINQAKDYFG